jgi:hypothetical protein
MGNGLNMVSSRPPKSIGLNKCLIGYSLYFVLATVNLIMERTIRTLKEMRQKAERSFIDNSLIVRNTRGDIPIPDTNADLEMIAELNQAISILENSTMAKEQTVNCS